MRNSVGEANITIIIIVIIGLVAVAGGILIPRLMDQMNAKSCCQENGGYVSGAKCKDGALDGQNIKGLQNNSMCK